MNISSVGMSAPLATILAPRPTSPASAANAGSREAQESAAHEAAESKLQQLAEGEVGSKINTYA